MLDLHRKKNQAKTDSDKELFEHQIKATDKEIKVLVFLSAGRLADLVFTFLRFAGY